MSGWDRLLWGVEFSSPRSEPILIGQAWAKYPSENRYDGEPSRALLFVTRAQARAWCNAEVSRLQNRLEGDICRAWKFTPVRVRERVTVVKR